MNKTIKEEIRTYAQMCSVDEAGYVAIEKPYGLALIYINPYPSRRGSRFCQARSELKKDHDFKMWKQFDYLLNKDK